jgi:hypothetical protein
MQGGADMSLKKVDVQLFRTDASAVAPDETVEFVFAHAAKEYARGEVDGGKAKRAVVRNRDGDVILVYPQQGR